MTTKQYKDFREQIDGMIASLQVAKESAFQSTRASSLTEDERLQEEVNLSYALYDVEASLGELRDEFQL